MHNRSKLQFSAIATAAAAAGLIATTASSAGQEQTITLVERARGGTVQVIDEQPLSKRGKPSLGDAIVFTKPLFTTDKRRIATAYGKATVVAAGRDFDHVSFVDEIVIKFADGTLTVHGYERAGQLPRLAVTGGTGAYAGARGTLEGTKTGDVIHLVS